MRSKTFVRIRSAGKRKKYAAVLQKIKKDGVCPFCPEGFIYHTRPILRSGKHWIVTENMNPYEGAKYHFLFVHKKHIESIEKMHHKALQELLGHIAWVKKNFKLKGASLFIRSGDMKYTGASVQHLHAHFISGGSVQKITNPILVTLGYKK